MKPVHQTFPLPHGRALASALQRDAWAITEEAFTALSALAFEAKGDRDVPEPERGTFATVGGRLVPMAADLVAQNPGEGDQVVVITLIGTIISRLPAWLGAWIGASSPQAFARLVKAAANDARINTIVLQIDSPGGTVAGIHVAADAVKYARGKKKVVAVVDDCAASGAYWIARQANEVVTARTGIVGSIGVIATHYDVSNFYDKLGVKPTVLRSADRKALGQPVEPMTGKAMKDRMELIMRFHAEFVADVAAGAGRKPDDVDKNWATGQVWVGEDAVTAGLADRVGGLDDVLAALTDPNPDVQDAGSGSRGYDDDEEASAPPGLLAALSRPNPTAADALAALGLDVAAPPLPSAPDVLNPPLALQEEPHMNIATLTAKLQRGEALSAEESRFLAAHLGQAPEAAAPQPGAAPQPAAVASAPAGAPRTAAPPAQPAQPASSAAASVPDTSAWPAEARAAFEALNTRVGAAEQRAESAERSAAAERDIRLKAHFAARAVALGQPVEFAASLRAASEKLSPEEYEAFEAALTRNSAAGLLDERGSSAPAAGGGEALAEVDTRARALMAQDPKLDYAAASKSVLSADPKLAARYDRAVSGR